jgi:hypothetical protein
MDYKGKNRESVTTNGRAAFYACMWNDFRQAAMDCGWALALHGSLNSDMDIMAMPWTVNAKSSEYMIEHLIKECFFDNEITKQCHSVTRNKKPNNRVVYTIPIFGDFYLDINIIELNTK